MEIQVYCLPLEKENFPLLNEDKYQHGGTWGCTCCEEWVRCIYYWLTPHGTWKGKACYDGVFCGPR